MFVFIFCINEDMLEKLHLSTCSIPQTSVWITFHFLRAVYSENYWANLIFFFTLMNYNPALHETHS